jgi:hypothetical protein
MSDNQTTSRLQRHEERLTDTLEYMNKLSHQTGCDNSVRMLSLIQRYKNIMKQIVLHSIEECTGRFVEFCHMDEKQLLSELAGDDEIRAYWAAEAISQDFDGFEQPFVVEVADLVEQWSKKFMILDHTVFIPLWTRMSAKFRQAKIDVLTCSECGQEFGSYDEMDAHQPIDRRRNSTTYGDLICVSSQ